MMDMSTGSSGAMAIMEHPESTISVPPLVNGRAVERFCKAVQSYADDVGSHNEVAAQLRGLRARLDNLCSLASLSRLAIVGHPRSFARVVDELYCLSVDFPSDPLEKPDGDGEVNEDEPDDRVLLAAAVDLFAGASFVSRDNPAQRDCFIVGIVRAIENAIAFPVTFSSEAATYVKEGDGTLSPLHVGIVIANATQRLLERDAKCVPRAPAHIRRRLEGLALKWMHKNPVDEFFAVIAGRSVRRIEHREDPQRTRPDDARVGDPVTLLLGEQSREVEAAVKRLQRALRRTPNLGLTLDGVFGPQVETAVKLFQQGAGLEVDGIVGPATWAALPDGGPMPTLRVGSTGAVVNRLQTLLTNGAPRQWNTTPQGIDGIFGRHTKASVVAFQAWGGVAQDGIVGDQTWAVSLSAASATLETAVGLQFVIG
jgi:Putative peptidoglycan binding domain